MSDEDDWEDARVLMYGFILLFGGLILVIILGYVFGDAEDKSIFDLYFSVSCLSAGLLFFIAVGILTHGYKRRQFIVQGSDTDLGVVFVDLERALPELSRRRNSRWEQLLLSTSNVTHHYESRSNPRMRVYLVADLDRDFVTVALSPEASRMGPVIASVMERF